MPTLNIVSEVSTCNLALSRIGSVSGINSLDTTADPSTEAQACAMWYAQDRDQLLTEFPWPWAQGSAVLGQVNTLYPATPEYYYSYRYPTDCLDAKRVVPTVTPSAIGTTPPQTTGLGAAILSYEDRWWLRPDGDACPWGFRVGSDTDGRLILTDLAQATLLYVRAVNDPLQFAPDFVDLLAWRLAVDLATELAISGSRADRAEKMYKGALMRTRGRLANEGQDGIPKRWPNSEFVRARF